MDSHIRVALIGVGNCASSLVQGVHYYSEDKPGLITYQIGPYTPSDIVFSAAFDVDSSKVGRRLDEAIYLGNNNTRRFCDVPQIDAIVHPAPALDGVGDKYSERLRISDQEASCSPADILRETKTQVLVNYLPVGSREATQWWADQALKAGCAFVNCIPEFIASDKEWASRFRDAGLPIIGDDVKSQFGATIVHRWLTRLMAQRGITLDRTYQLNFGGNMDFYNMLNSERLTSKRASKRGSVEAEVKHPIDPRNVHISPSDYVEWLEDRKWCYIFMEGTAFGGAPLRAEVKLEVWDSPNSAGVVIDAIRWAKIGLNLGMSGPMEAASAVYMKSPPKQMEEEAAMNALREEALRH